MTREITVPTEAVEIVSVLLALGSKPGGLVGCWRDRADQLLQAALPVLRSEWEEELLSDAAVEAFKDAALTQSAQLKVGAHQLNNEIRDGLQAALGKT